MSDARGTDEIFARIACRYDRINRILSLGQERRWRQTAIRHLPQGTVLDLGSGTGDAAEQLAPRRVVALDPVVEMLELSHIPQRVAAVGEALPFPDDSFDSVFSAYVVRNLASVPKTLSEIHRVLKPGGVAAIVDLSRPTNRWLATLHRVGSAVVLPLVGAVLARSPREYWYLHRSLDSLPAPEVLYADSPLSLEKTWRMGPMGFVYWVVLTKSGTSRV